MRAFTINYYIERAPPHQNEIDEVVKGECKRPRLSRVGLTVEDIQY